MSGDSAGTDEGIKHFGTFKAGDYVAVEYRLVQRMTCIEGGLNTIIPIQILPWTPPAIKAVAYEAHVQNIGWQGWVKNGEIAGTTGQSLRLEAIKIKLEGFELKDINVLYRVHIQNIGWQEWVKNGEIAGTTGQSLRLEAIEIKLEGSDTDGFGIIYQAHVQNIGWQEWVKNGEIAGTTGQSLRLEAMKIFLAIT
ncbi:MAG TPA: Ig domain-containing protein [Nostocaceae cyanobacterium]|nr:Ig domain-containing protein [Nostocaceae cyanobacterium]